MSRKISCMKRMHLYRCSFECLLRDFMVQNKMIYYGRKMLLCFALTTCCPPLLQPNPIYSLWTHLLISSCHSHLLSRSLSIFFRPPIWHFSASLSLHPSPYTVCNSALFMPHLTRSCFLPSFPASLSKPTPAWPISLMTSSRILSHANNDNRNPVSLRFARGWISPERANRKINHCSWGLQKMVCQQTMMTVF